MEVNKNEQEHELLLSTFNLVKENNKMLHKMRRAQKIADFMRFMYWLIIIGISIGGYYVVQPYVTQMQDLMHKTGITINSLNSSLPKNITPR